VGIIGQGAAVDGIENELDYPVFAAGFEVSRPVYTALPRPSPR
jgi:hypothetical protein